MVSPETQSRAAAYLCPPIEGVDPSIKSAESLSTRFTKLGEFSMLGIPKIEVFRGNHRKTIIVAGIPHEEDPYFMRYSVTWN
jgi:hypothetical protein